MIVSMTIYELINVLAFYSDFSKAFDVVPHHEVLVKIDKIGIGVCL